MSKIEQKKSRRERRSEDRNANRSSDGINRAKNKKKEKENEKIDEETLHIKDLINTENENALNTRAIMDRKNLKEDVIKVLKEFLDKTNTDARLEINLQYRQLSSLFTPEELDELELQRRLDSKGKPLDNILFRPSYRNRRKTSRYLTDGEDEFGSTWNPEHINQLIIGLWNKEPVPTVSINIYYLKKYGLATVWDGDSKTRAIHAFLEDKDVLEVYTGSQNKVGKMTKFFSQVLSREVVKSRNPRILEAIRAFDIGRKAGDHKLNYMTRTWLEESDFGDLVEIIGKTIPLYRIDNMDPSTEGDVYSKEGESGTPQTPIMLTMSRLSDDVLPLVYKDEHGIDVHTMYGSQTIVGNEKLHKDLTTTGNFLRETFGLRLPPPPQHGDKEYGMKDEFLFAFLATAGWTIDKDNIDNPSSFDTKKLYSDPTILRAFVRKLDEPKGEAVEIVNSWHRSFQYFCEKHEEYKPQLVNKLKETVIARWRAVEVLLGACPKESLKDSGCGVLNETFRSHIRHYMQGKSARGNLHKRMLRDAARRVDGIDKNVDAGKHGGINKFSVSEFSTLILNRTLNYVFANHSKLNNPNHVTEVLDIIYSKFLSEESGWISYVYSQDDYEDMSTFKAKDFVNVFGWEQDQIDDIVNGGCGTVISNYVNPSIKFPCSFGEFVLKNGGALEKVAILANKFYEEEVIPILDEQYAECASNSKIRRELAMRLEDSKDFPQPMEDYVVLGGSPIKVKEIEIGHIVPKSVGGLLYAKKNKLSEHIPLFVPETRQTNMDNPTDTRDLVGWYLSQKESFSEWKNKVQSDLTEKVNNGFDLLDIADLTTQFKRQVLLTEKLLNLVEEALHLHKKEVEQMGMDISLLDNN